MNHPVKVLALVAFLVPGSVFSQSDAPVPSAGPTFAVILPERVDRDWYWIMYSDELQHIVQSQVEKALIGAGMNVIDLSAADMPAFNGNWSSLTSRDFAVLVGNILGVDYIVSGYATAVKASESISYDIRTVRTQVDITAKVIRVRDGHILEVFDAGEISGGQSVQAAGKNALKEAGQKIARQIKLFAATLETGQQAP